jgi:hypothetical protein
LLFFIILVGIVFDIVGIAATAAQEAPFHARASRRLLGAKKSIWIVRNADKVASFCNDVVGDICGTVSGAVGASIVFSLAKYFDQYLFLDSGDWNDRTGCCIDCRRKGGR